MAQDASGDLVVSYSTVSAYRVSAAPIYWSKWKAAKNHYSFRRACWLMAIAAFSR